MKPRKRPRERKAERIGPRIVRAWFDTVINPLLTRLEHEQQLLAMKNWTWRFKPAGLEAIREIRGYIEPDALPNLEQFEGLHPDVRRPGEAHDKRVSELREQCKRLHSALVRSAEFQQVFSRLTSEEALRDIGANLHDLFGAYPEENYRDVLAEDIVNSRQVLASYYSSAPLWNKHRETLLAVREHPQVREHWVATNRSGEALLRETQRLNQILKDLRLKLSLAHDVPYVTRGEQSAS